ncbi:Serine/threonine-protein kinase AtPK1/AtPK6 [Acorus gramineus]|uniref:Serine/threonine-protein kinase AtPK1/AtPK6 n=1 Tax=Acorus gramineus TaxID=55184 RepID=A0AAV9A1A4_ACOGR|nr:Serine/threonine-protein kinase AtPK1/AtPK6 [Acorus gramineus]
MEKVAIAKQFIENHYRSQMKNLQERRERRWVLERRLASSSVSEEEQVNLIKDLERKETEFMRLKRHKICTDDFELLTIIGRGAFGEVRLCREKTSGNIYAMKKLKKSEMLSRGQVNPIYHFFCQANRQCKRVSFSKKLLCFFFLSFIFYFLYFWYMIIPIVIAFSFAHIFNYIISLYEAMFLVR